MLYEYKSSTFWRWNGTQISNAPAWSRYPYVRQNFVKFIEHTHTDENGGRGDLTHYDYTRGHYESRVSSLKPICPVQLIPVDREAAALQRRDLVPPQPRRVMGGAPWT